MKDISFRIILLISIISISTCSFSRNKNNNLKIIRKLNAGLRYLQESESDTSTDDYYPTGNHTYVRSSSGLSAGQICAIAIPCIAALVGIGVAAAILGGSAPVAPIAPISAVSTTNIPPPNVIETSVTKLAAPQEIPIQPKIELPPEPIKPIIKPSYPITNIENPVINLPSSQQISQTNMVPVQQMKLVPIQKVEMVPVQKVEMVPVKEVIPTNQSIKIVPKINTQIQGGQGIQGGDFISAPEGYGTAAL
jgi:hypothetical protein